MRAAASTRGREQAVGDVQPAALPHGDPLEVLRRECRSLLHQALLFPLLVSCLRLCRGHHLLRLLHLLTSRRDVLVDVDRRLAFAPSACRRRGSLHDSARASVRWRGLRCFSRRGGSSNGADLRASGIVRDAFGPLVCTGMPLIV